MRIARIRSGAEVLMARIEGAAAVPIAREGRGPGDDAVRDALAAATDLALAPPIAPSRPLDEVTLLAPVRAPQKILAIGRNYRDHAAEMGGDVPQRPMVFAKAASSIADPGAPIRFRADDSTSVDYEAELAVVIGRRARRVTEADALSYVAGYTVCDDVTARDAQRSEGQWVRAKSFDTFCPLGPWLVTADEIPDPQDVRVRCRVNGELRQDASTSSMIFGVAHLVSWLSRTITLEPGDVIATGTPAGVGSGRTPPVFLRDGDVVEVEVDRIGTLANPVVVDP